MSGRPEARPRVLVALPHPSLRGAVAAELSASPHLSVIGEVGDLEGAVHEALVHQADGIVIGTALLRGDLVASLRKLRASLPGRVRIVVVGTESSGAYARALEAAGAASYVSLQAGAHDLSASVQAAMLGAPS
jgi:DNA-binding NarL/FixJ family response regulator